VLRANTINQIEHQLADMFNLSMDSRLHNDWQDYTSATAPPLKRDERLQVY
jgi:hypothetical protein